MVLRSQIAANADPDAGPSGIGQHLNELFARRIDPMQVLDDNNSYCFPGSRTRQGPDKIEKLEKAITDVFGFFASEKERLQVQNLFLNTALNKKGNWIHYPLYKTVLTSFFPPKVCSLLADNPNWKVKLAVTSCFEGEMNEVFDNGVNKSELSLLKIGHLIDSVLSIHTHENITSIFHFSVLFD